MNRLSVLSVALLALVALAAGGCCEAEKQALAEVQQQYNDLQMQHQQTLSDLNSCQSERMRLQDELSMREDEATRLQTEMLTLRGTGPAPDDEAPEVPRGWQETATGAKLTIASDVLFAPGKASLSKAGQGKIREAAQTIKASYPNSIVRVYGFTDSDPIVKSKKLWKDNLDLSANRAMAVTRDLRKMGVEAESIETIAMGATHFVAPNASKAGKAKNRRVEIVVVTQQ
jgi:chemotaxis protein MotB